MMTGKSNYYSFSFFIALLLCAFPLQVFPQEEMTKSEIKMVDEAVDLYFDLCSLYETGNANMDRVLSVFDNSNRYRVTETDTDGLYLFEDLENNNKYGHRLTLRLTAEMFQIALWPGTTDFYAYWLDQIMSEMLTRDVFVYHHNHYTDLDEAKVNSYNVRKSGVARHRLRLKSIPEDGGTINVRLAKNSGIHHEEYKAGSMSHLVELIKQENLTSEWQSDQSTINHCSVARSGYGFEFSCLNGVGRINHQNNFITQLSDDFELSISFRLGDESEFAGILFGQDPNTGHVPIMALVNSQGGLNIDKWDQEGRRALATYRNSSAVEGYNTFDLRKIGDKVYLYSNRRLVYTAPFENWSSTNIGLMVGENSKLEIFSLQYSYLEPVKVSLRNYERQELRRLESNIQNLLEHEFNIVDIEQGLFEIIKPETSRSWGVTSWGVTYNALFTYTGFSKSSVEVPFSGGWGGNPEYRVILKSGCSNNYMDCIHVREKSSGEKNEYVDTHYDSFTIDVKNERDVPRLIDYFNKIVEFYR